MPDTAARPAPCACRAHSQGALQIEYSLLERTVEGELVPMALEMGPGLTPWSPIPGGTFTILDAVVLAWVQSRAGVASTIIGARRLDQLDANLTALDVRLAPEHVH